MIKGSALSLLNMNNNKEKGRFSHKCLKDGNRKVEAPL
jgi:hypothetical protein